MVYYLLAAVLFVLGLAAVGAATFGRQRNRRLGLAASGVALWGVTLFLYGCVTPTVQPPPAATAPAVSPTAAETSTDIAVSPLQPPAMLASLPGRVAYHGEIDGQLEIFVTNPGSADVQRLTFSPDRDIEPAWSPDGQSIAFSSGRDDPNNMQLYVMRADGSDQHPVMPFTPADQIGPRWSPDGQWILFHSNAEIDGAPRFEVYKVRADGTDLTNLTNMPGNHFRADWSPDGERIVFVSERDGNRELYVMDADGQDQARLTDDFADDNAPRWSPDGRKILFESHRDGANTALYTIDVAGVETGESMENTVTLLTFPGFNSETAAWAEDGQKVLFSSDRDTTGEINWELYAVDPDGSDLVRLTQRPGSDRFPDWTPQ